MILRGLFLATDAEIDYYYHGGVGTFFPDAYDEFVAALPDLTKRPLLNYVLDLIQRGDSTAQWKYCKAWTRYEVRIGARVRAGSHRRERAKKSGKKSCSHFSSFSYTVKLDLCPGTFRMQRLFIRIVFGP
jgi:hypothetical protein